MNSMTGYGSGRHRLRGLELDVHVKSVNGRFLELRFHLPKEYAPFESDLRRAFVGFERGTLDVYVQRRAGKPGGGPAMRVNEVNARYWTRTLRDLNHSLKFKTEVTLRDVLSMPHVLEADDQPVDATKELGALLKTTRTAARACARVRAARARG